MSTAALTVWGRTDARDRTWRLTPRGKQGLRLLRTLVLAAVIAAAALLLVLMARPQQAIGGQAALPPAETIIVEDGQSLWSIAAEVSDGADPRDTMHAIVEMNGLDTSVVHPGQELQVPAR